MATTEHQRRRLIERNIRSAYRVIPRGPSKAELMRELAEAVRNTAARSVDDEAMS